ncbi:hypothetical protein LPJ61_000088 [Coemansia biformis]|uniref:Uncharacterized protein n=1 Tax=Coemansia biformis TaxID=1286918 RepID=A0A9W7YHU7_9FUNG|nr:hypothetical protein LPJ61_000088 [Coemansia biformis]
MDQESFYWDQYCSDGDGILPPLPYTERPALVDGSGSSRDSYWSRYSCTRSSMTDQCTPGQQQQRRLWRLLAVPDRLTALRLGSGSSAGGCAEPATTTAAGGTEAGRSTDERAAAAGDDAAAAAEDNAGHAGPCDPAQISSSGSSNEAIVPLDSPTGPAFQGVNPAALTMRLAFLKQQMDQDERLLLDTSA